MTRTVLSLLLPAALVFCGCSMERHVIESPGKSQTIRVESGDRFFMTLEENTAAGLRWYAKSDDPDVDVTVDHVAGKDGNGRVGALGKAEVTVRVHRGYDGPSALTFTYRRRGAKEPEKTFVITLFRRTGNVAFWE